MQTSVFSESAFVEMKEVGLLSVEEPTLADNI